MDDVALRYLLLAMRIGRHHPGLVDSYTGPPEIAEAVAGEDPIPPAELHGEALRLADTVADLATATPLERRRAAWLSDQLVALSALARLADGEEIGFVDLAEELFDIQVRPEPEETFAAARSMIEAALPGSGSLQARLQQHERSATLPPEAVLATLRALADAMRDRVLAQMWLPSGESVAIEALEGQQWVAEMQYLGNRHSRVRVNLDLPVSLSRVVELAAHECYPGHHAEAVVKDALLVATGHAEVSLVLDLAPEAVIHEGLATYAREVVMSDAELAAELGGVARRLGLSVDIGAEMIVQRAQRLLVPAIGNAALQLHVDGRAPEAVHRYLGEVGLLADAQLEATFSLISDPIWGRYFFTYIEGRLLVGEWLEAHGQTHGFGRLLAEQQTPGALRSELRTA